MHKALYVPRIHVWILNLIKNKSCHLAYLAQHIHIKVNKCCLSKSAHIYLNNYCWTFFGLARTIVINSSWLISLQVYITLYIQLIRPIFFSKEMFLIRANYYILKQQHNHKIAYQRRKRSSWEEMACCRNASSRNWMSKSWLKFMGMTKSTKDSIIWEFTWVPPHCTNIKLTTEHIFWCFGARKSTLLPNNI